MSSCLILCHFQFTLVNMKIYLHLLSFLNFEVTFSCYFSRWEDTDSFILHGPLARYVKLWNAHAPGMPGTFSPLSRVSDPEVHHGTCMTHVPWCMSESLNNGFLWSRWRGKRSRHSRCMRNRQFYISGMRPIVNAMVTDELATQRARA